jgi:hypothetical protein
VSPAYVQKQLGHTSISMTVDIYGHWVPGEGRAGLEAALTVAPMGHRMLPALPPSENPTRNPAKS